MKENKTKCGGREPVRICPVCGAEYRAYPALSRSDNATEICPDCGILEALASIGCTPDEQVRILDRIRSCSRGRSV